MGPEWWLLNPLQFDPFCVLGLCDGAAVGSPGGLTSCGSGQSAPGIPMCWIQGIPGSNVNVVYFSISLGIPSYTCNNDQTNMSELSRNQRSDWRELAPGIFSVVITPDFFENSVGENQMVWNLIFPMKWKCHIILEDNPLFAPIFQTHQTATGAHDMARLSLTNHLLAASSAVGCCWVCPGESNAPSRGWKFSMVSLLMSTPDETKPWFIN